MRIVFDYSKLRGKIREKFGSEAAFAEALGISGVSLSAKLNNKVQFTQEEIDRSCDLLEISRDFIPVYFYSKS